MHLREPTLASMLRQAAPVVLALGVAVLACGRTVPLRFPPHVYPWDGGPAADAGLDAGPLPCEPGKLELNRARPNVLFVLDRSGSMGDPFGTGTRWEALSAALAQSLPPVDQTMAVGALLYPADLACTPPTVVDLQPALGHVQQLIDLLAVNDPGGGTPTAEVLGLAGDTLRAVRSASSARALVLATDGQPNCNDALDPKTCVCVDQAQQCCGDTLCRTKDPDQCLDDLRTVSAIGGELAKGVPTYVIGIASAADVAFIDVLNRMANAGGRPQVGQARQFYAADSPQDLQRALGTIRDQLSACIFLTPSVPDAQGSISITLDGVPLIFDASGANGWQWGDRTNGEVVLRGSACTHAAANPSAKLVATVACSDVDGGP